MANNIILPFSELQAELNDEAMIDPDAIIEITENGRYNVARYGYADVNVEGGGGETWETVFEGSVTTEDGGVAPEGIIEGVSEITADTIKVTFNGTEYTCEKQVIGGDVFYGDTDGSHSEYPFSILVDESVYLITESAGTYTLKIEEPQSGGSSDFSTAEVSVENNTEELINGIYVRVVDTPLSGVVPMNTLSFGSRTYNVPLYKGACYWTFNDSANVSVSGDIEWDSENRKATITGDCTITIGEPL